jgi:hypothetical protein
MALHLKPHMVLLPEMLDSITVILWVHHTSLRARYSNQIATCITEQ